MKYNQKLAIASGVVATVIAGFVAQSALAQATQGCNKRRTLPSFGGSPRVLTCNDDSATAGATFPSTTGITNTYRLTVNAKDSEVLSASNVVTNSNGAPLCSAVVDQDTKSNTVAVGFCTVNVSAGPTHFRLLAGTGQGN